MTNAAEIVSSDIQALGSAYPIVRSDGGTVNMYNEGGNKNNLLLWEIGA